MVFWLQWQESIGFVRNITQHRPTKKNCCSTDNLSYFPNRIPLSVHLSPGLIDFSALLPRYESYSQSVNSTYRLDNSCTNKNDYFGVVVVSNVLNNCSMLVIIIIIIEQHKLR